jgi:Flp pilus assembly protein TadB
MESLTTLDVDLAILSLGTGEPVLTGADVVARLTRVGAGGAAIGFAAAIGLWLLSGADGLPVVAIPAGVAVGLLASALSWRRMRRRAAVIRGSVERRLPRILTGTRMLLESGAATPERALAVAVSLYDDPAADLMREALRYREVNRVPIETGLEAIAATYGVQQLNRLADAFRVSGRYGTQLATTISGFAADLRRASHTDYRERMTRAPVLMTVPALIFFVAPLLVLVLYLVFAPLGSVLSQL